MIMYMSVLLGYILDFILGDPFGRFHPVCLIGSGISWFEQRIRKCLPKKRQGELVGGVLLVVVIVGLSGGISYAILWVAGKIHWSLKLIVGTILCYQMLATKSLKVESSKVYKAFEEKDLEKARMAVSMIVGRDTSVLDETGIIKATVETIAENTADGSIAPLLYMALFGPVGGVVYKAVNTMDSMVGYKNERYLYFGRAAAYLDDVLNYIPARVSGYMMVLASVVLRLDARNAWKMYRRDRRNHASPNSAHTEAVMAGALQVQLAGDAVYFGKLYKKKTIGDPIRQVQPSDIVVANRLLYGTSLLTFVLIMLLYGLAFLA